MMMIRSTTQSSSSSSSLVPILFCLVSLLLCFFLEPIHSAAAGGGPSVEQQCTGEFAKVGTCLNFATGKAPTPSADCCNTVKEIRKANPVCLCFIIQQTHKGEASLKQLGLQEDKLLQLPSVCKLTDTSIADCPKLLNLTPSSPDYAIFTNNASKPETSTTTPSSATSAKGTTTNAPSSGFLHGPNLATTASVLIPVFALIGSVFLINM